jgi:hypothetical protein
MPATLTQIRTWSTEHLVEAASYWNNTANQWEDAFLQMRNQSYAIAWQGAGGDGLRLRTGADLSIVSGKADQLRQAAEIARNGASDISAAQRRVLYAVEDAQNAGFNVGEGLSVTDTRTSATAAEQAARQAQAEAFATDMRLRAEQLDGADVRVAGQLVATTADLGNVSFAPAHNGDEIQLVDFGAPRPEAPNPAPDPPPGGWSNDPLMRAAQKIAYGHAFKYHGEEEFPGMTKDQLADLIYNKLKMASSNPGSLRLGPSSTDGAPVIYDPSDNVMIIRDPGAADDGTVFKPKSPSYVDGKFGGWVRSFKPGDLADAPLPPGVPVELVPPAAPKPAPVEPAPVEPVPVEPVPREPPPSTGGFGRGSTGLGPEGGVPGGMGGIGGGGHDLPFPGIAGEEPL